MDVEGLRPCAALDSSPCRWASWVRGIQTSPGFDSSSLARFTNDRAARSLSAAFTGRRERPRRCVRSVDSWAQHFANFFQLRYSKGCRRSGSKWPDLLLLLFVSVGIRWRRLRLRKGFDSLPHSHSPLWPDFFGLAEGHRHATKADLRLPA